MRKGKPRTNPDKPQNNKVNPCPYYEEHEGFTICEGGHTNASTVCKGNPHNCVKTLYHREASCR